MFFKKENTQLEKVVSEQQDTLNLLINDIAAIGKHITELEEKLAAVTKTVIIFAEQWHTETPLTPAHWGLRKDGTPRLKPGRKLGSGKEKV
jgi:uncharacterized coiled-coil protein SlyX